MTTAITAALKAFKLSAADILSIEKSKDLAGKVYLKKGKGALFLEGWTEEVRRKKQPDGSLSFFRLHLNRPAWRVRWNSGPWVNLAKED